MHRYVCALTSAVAGALGADAVSLGIQFGDYCDDNYHYWDCSEEFREKLQAVSDLNDRCHIELFTPFVNKKKSEIVAYGHEINVPYQDTWSCYDPELRNGKYFPCGKCPTCRNRKSAFKENGLEDPTEKGVDDE